MSTSIVDVLQGDLAAQRAANAPNASPVVATLQSDFAKQQAPQGGGSRSGSILDTLQGDLARQSGTQNQSSGLGTPITDDSTIEARDPSLWERFTNIFSHVPAVNPNVRPEDERLIAPEEAMTPVEQQQHPIATGAGQFFGGMTSPQNAAILAASGGLGSLPGAAGKVLTRVASAGFSAQMLKAAYDQVPAIRAAADRGDDSEVKRLATQFVLNLGGAGLAGRQAFNGETAGIAPSEESAAVSSPEPTSNQRVAGIASGIAPLKEPTGMGSSGPTPRPVRGLLTAGFPNFEDTLQSVAGPGEEPIQLGEGARTVEGAIRAPGRTIDQIRALPAGSNTPEETEFLSGARTPTPLLPLPSFGGVVEDAAPGYRPGNTLSPDSIVRTNAEGMVREAANFLSQQERPGRYRADISTAPGEMRTAANAREQDNAWFGVNSLRGQFPWFANMNESPGQLIDAVKRGRGPVYERLVNAAADYYQRRSAEAAPYLREIAPQAKQLADQVRGVDPDTAANLDQLARGYFPLYSSLYDFADQARKELGNAQDIADFSRAVDQLAAEERGANVSEGSSAVFNPGAPRGGTQDEFEESDNPLGPLLGSVGRRQAEAGVITPDLLRDVFSGRLPKEAWQQFAAEPAIRGLGIGDKYAKVAQADPAIAEGLHVLDNAPAYFRAKAAQHIQNIVGGLSRDQERLFTLMADADSRENLRTQHPQEYAQALRDPAVQDALRKYRPLEQQLTSLRQSMGGGTLNRDYLRRVYDEHVSGIGQQSAPGNGERGTTAFDRIIRPQRIGNLSREATAEYHYQNGLHEFGPAFGTKFIGTNLAAVRNSIARDFISKATEIEPGDAEPRSITYEGQRYYRPDVAAEMREAGQKGVQAYDRYDPTAGLKYPEAGSSKFLGPRDVVRTLNDYGLRPDEGESGLRRFFQEQTIGFGFGIPHVANILRRVTQSVPFGAANPKAWVDAWRVAFGKELRQRGINGLDDPTFDRLLRQGSITTGEAANLKRYWGGNLNPANWARSLAGIGHKVIFDPKAFGGLGGFDQRARLYVADLVKSRNPGFSDSEVARAVNDQLGDYNRLNWSDRQKLAAKFMLFPGWDASSIRWVIQHPIKTTVPPALLTLIANRALHQLGQNRDEDQNDISAVHVGDRAYSPTLLRESMARNLLRPAINYAQSKISGETGGRASAAAARGIRSGAAGLTGIVRPEISGFLALAANKQGMLSGRDLVSPQDYQTAGKILPSRALEKQAALVVRSAFPAVDRMLDSDQNIDLRSFVGGNLGAPNYRNNAQDRLLQNTSEASRVYGRLAQLAKTNPAQARQFLADPDNAAFSLFHKDLSQLSGTLQKLDAAQSVIQSSNVSDKARRLQMIETARTQVLQQADGMDKLLFQRKQALRSMRSRPIASGQPLQQAATR